MGVNPYIFYSSYCAEYRKVIMYAISQGWRLPSIRQQIIHDRFMRKLITSGAFAKADWIYYMANDCDRNGAVNFCRINWKNPGQYILTETNSSEPVRYLKNYGPYFNTGSAVHNVFDVGWSPSVGPNFTQNNNCIIHAIESSFGGSGAFYRDRIDPGSFNIFIHLDGLVTAYNNSTGNTVSSRTGNTVPIMNRRTSSTSAGILYVDESLSVTAIESNISGGSASATGGTLKLMGYPQGMSGVPYDMSAISVGSPVAFFFGGAALTNTEFVDLKLALDEITSSIHYSRALFTSGTFTVPDGVTELLVECWGGGGSGSGRVPNGIGPGGGGGAYSSSLVSVTPLEEIPYTIGAGGVGTTTAGNNGGDTSWNSGQVLAKGGLAPATALTGGSGGSSVSGVGDVKFDGGKGGDVPNATSTSYTSGSGGSAGSRSGNGVVGLTGVSPVVSSFRGGYNMLGAGAPGYGHGSNANGITGMYGSGGGGARKTSGSKNGGNGGSGYIRVSCPIVY